MSEHAVVPWRWVTPPGQLDANLGPLLARVDAYREAWEEFVAHMSRDEFEEARRSSLRRHAIETGIIERLYDVSWGVTEALVAHGLTLEVAERAEGGLDEAALTTIQTQFEALEFLVHAVREGRDLSVGFVRQLHVAITRNQITYRAHDALGRSVERPLRHGEWKQADNHVRRRDGGLLEYTPYEHVDAEMDRLVELYHETADAHPVVRAAWLHHRFIGIHPFEDGNGRVARALVLLVLLRARFAPLVVDRDRREAYLDALDAANDGDLEALVRLFAELEQEALVSELQFPRRETVGATPVDVARGYAQRVLAADESRAKAVANLATDVQHRLESELERLGRDLRDAFREIDAGSVFSVVAKGPPEPEAGFWRGQLARAAKTANFFANIHTDGSWWVRLHVVVRRQALRYVAAVQKVGHGETGIIAVTVFGELVPPRDSEDESRTQPLPLFEPTSADHVTLNRTDHVEERWPEICELLERTLAASVAEFGRLLG